MNKDPILNLKFNNRECRKIKSAAETAGLTVEEYVKSIANREVKDLSDPIQKIINEAIKSSGKKNLTSLPMTF